jgi:DNA ligase-1
MAESRPVPEKEPAKKTQAPVSTESPAAVASSSSTVRHFEFVEGKSSKFWEISTDGCEVTVRYGRIGTAGTSKVKAHADAKAARREADRLIAEKTGKGYVETRS